MDFEGFGRALYIVAYLQDQKTRGRRVEAPGTRERSETPTPPAREAFTARPPRPRGPDPEEEEAAAVEALLKAGDLDGAIEACGPMAVRVWLEAMSRRNPARTRIRATEAVMARVRPVKGVEERRATVHIHFSPAERQAIEVVCREAGVDLPALPEP